MRIPAVANRFYPGSTRALDLALQDLFAPYQNREQNKALVAVSPHAGYVYSGALAAKTMSSVIVPNSVLIIGPNHHGQGASVALSLEDWDMVGSSVPNNLKLGRLLLDNSDIIHADEVAHKFEHSLEVQIPFLRFQQKDLAITPLVVSAISLPQCEEIAIAIAKSIQAYDKDVLIVASTDMSHYESRENAKKKDELALLAIRELDPEALYRTVFNNRISMCGVIPVVISLMAAKLLGASTAIQVGYTDSGYVSGDSDQVVGYAGIIVR